MKKRDGKIKWVNTTALMLAAGIGCVQAGCGNSSVQDTWMQEGRRKVPVGSLELVPVELAVSEQETEEGTVVSIGSLEMALPPGWELEMRVSEEGVEQYVLVDMHSQCEDEEIEGHKDGYEHDIVITPYRIKQMPERNCQLAAEIRAYFPVPELYGITGATKTSEINGCRMYGEDSDACEREYFLFSENESGGMELFHIKEGNSWITSSGNDIEAFWKFMDKGLVWTNGGRYQVQRFPKWEMESYFLLNEDTQDPLFMIVRNDAEEISVYRTADYGTEICSQQPEGSFYPDDIGITDLNQDGYEDVLCNYWVLDPEWSLDSSAENKFSGYLWDAENKSFVYLDSEEMWEECGSFWEKMWKTQEEKKEDGIGQIPKDLSAYISEYLLKSKEELRDATIGLVSDKELTMEEVKELAGENRDIKKEMLVIAANHFGMGIWLRVDADNDGIEDVFLCEYLGGTLGPVTYYLFTGTEDGHYTLTAQTESLKEEFAFIHWKGKNYLMKTTWEFTKKCVDGISLECYENGKHQGGVWLSITAQEGKEARNIEISYLADKKYQGLADGLKEFSETYETGSRVPGGTAEEEVEDSDYNRSCDIDNDGIADKYTVSLWQTTNYYTVDRLIFWSEEGLQGKVYDMINEDEAGGIPLNLWVDKTEYGNVVYVLYEDGLYDFHICGYLLAESGQKLVQADCWVQTEVTPQEIEG